MKSYQTKDVENEYGSFEPIHETSRAKRHNIRGYAVAAAGFAMMLVVTLASSRTVTMPVATTDAFAVETGLSPESLAAKEAIEEQINTLKAQLAEFDGLSTTDNFVVPEGATQAELSMLQYDLIYNFGSFVTAAMGSATFFFFFQFTVIDKEFKNALLVSAMVTLIACYHYFRIFGSFTSSYFALGGVVYETGEPFNDAYRYVDWLLTVPLLLMELILVMQLSPEETVKQCVKLGSLAAIMVILGYPGEISSSMSTRWMFWGLAMIPFLIIVYTLFFGLADAVDKQPDSARGLVNASRWVTVVSWCVYPLVFIFPMIGFSGASAQTAVQVGYSIADVIAKPILGLIVWRIAVAKSSA